MPRSKAKPKAPACWHCAGSGSCDCAFCLIETQTARLAGPCGFCAGRAEMDAMFRFYAERGVDIDPRDHRHYEHHAAADGNKAFKVFLPLVVFRHYRETS